MIATSIEHVFYNENDLVLLDLGPRLGLVRSHLITEGLVPAPLQLLLVVEILLQLRDPTEPPLLPPASDLANHSAQSPPPPASQRWSPPPVPSPPPATALLPGPRDPLKAGLAVDHPVVHIAPEVEPALSRHGDVARVPHPLQPLPRDVFSLLHLNLWCLLSS